MRVIIAQWSNGTTEVYTSVKKFIDSNPTFKEDNIFTYLQRKKKPYVDEFVILTRIELNKKRQ